MPLADPFAQDQDAKSPAVLRPGQTAVPCVSPVGEKGLTFDGLKTSVSTLDLSKAAAKLDGFDYSVSFWFLCAGIQNVRGKEHLSGNTILPGFTAAAKDGVLFNMPVIGPPGKAVGCAFSIVEDGWNHVVFTYSVSRRIMRLQVNGRTVLEQCGYGKFYPLALPANGIFSIGSFKGSIAGLKIYDDVLNPEEAMTTAVPETVLNDIRKQIDALRDGGAKAAAETLYAEFDALRKDPGKVQSAALNTLLTRIGLVKKLLPGIRAMGEGSLKDAPFVLFQAQTTSPEIRLPIRLPSNPVYTDVVRAVAAGDEVQSATFFLYSYRDLKGVEFFPGELKDDRGNVLPPIEMAFVQCWYQSGWNSYFGGTGNYVPGLLLRDPYLMKIDEQKKQNLLRINYGGKPAYFNTVHSGSVLKGPCFLWEFEPVRDADKLLPCPMEFGRNRQFWMDFHVPAGSPAGTYRSRVAVKADGADAGYFTVELTVLPFDLPLPCTQFDHGKPYQQMLYNSMDLTNLKKILKDPVKAKTATIAHLKNLKDHAILYQRFDFSFNENDFEEMVQLYRDMNLPITFVARLSATDSNAMAERDGAPPLSQVGTPEWCRADLKRMEDCAEYVAKTLDSLNIPRSAAHFDGFDEAQDAGSLRRMAAYRDIVFRKGMRTHSTGWEDNFHNLPAYETLHDTAALVDRKNAERWHAIGCEILPYCAPFIGPDNPDLMRRSHGINMYRTNQDGWTELAYDGGSKYHTWNDLYGYDTTYRAFRFVVATAEGPIINTVAFSGMRDGQNDVRYATLMYQLADDCFASGKVENIIAAREAVGWFRDLPYPYTGDLDKLRAGLTCHILAMMKQLGRL